MALTASETRPSAPVIDLVAVGNATIDDLVFRDGTTRMGQPGGNAVYAAHGALMWGGRVGLCAMVGADYPRDLLGGAQLDLAGVHMIDGPSLRNWGLYEDDGACQYIFRGIFGPHAHARFSPLPAHLPPTYGEARYAHLAPMPLAQTLALLDTLAETRRRGGICVDPDVRYCAGLSQQSRDALLSRLTFFLPSEREAALLYPGLSPRDVLEELRAGYTHLRVAAVKLAAQGSLVYDRERDIIVHLPAAPARVVDTTGAGDAFCGGFLAGYEQTGDGIAAAMHGIISASFIVETYGVPPVGAVRRDAAEQRLAAYRQMLGPRLSHRIGPGADQPAQPRGHM